jgi:hypothetical protein
MAPLHRAELRPSKIELVAGWAPSQPWFEASAGPEPVTVASFRFDDAAGEVGIETLLVRAGDGPVLGRRWVYDGAGDPAYLTAVATAGLTGGRQADQYVDVDVPSAVLTGTWSGHLEPRPLVLVLAP